MRKEEGYDESIELRLWGGGCQDESSAGIVTQSYILFRNSCELTRDESEGMREDEGKDGRGRRVEGEGSERDT